MINKSLQSLLENRIKKIKETPDWFQSSFPAQIDFILDPAQLKAGHCTRRAGKSYGVALYMAKEAWENPGVSIVYIGLTQSSAMKIIWKDILKVIDRQFNLNCKFDEYKGTVTFPNGSVIYVTGADARTEDMAKLLGQKFKLAVIDEWSKYRIDLKALIYDVLKPSVADYRGTIVGIGTATNFVKSFAAKVVSGEEKGWSVHKWSALDNPHMKEQFADEMAKLKAANPKVETESWYRQNYLGEWVVDRSKLIYKSQVENLVDYMPETRNKKPFEYVLGIVLSFQRFTGFSVLAYSEGYREAFIVESHKWENMDIYHAVEEAGRLHAIYNFSSMVCADASKKLAEMIRQRYTLQIQEVTDKLDKSSLIALFNSELNLRNIKVLSDNTELIEEWDSIISDDRMAVKHLNKIIEHPICHRSIADATLFAWQKCYNFYYNPVKQSDDPNDSYWEDLAETIKEKEDLTEFSSDSDFEQFYGRQPRTS